MSKFGKFSASKVQSVIVPCKGPPPRMIIFCTDKKGGIAVFKSERLLKHATIGSEFAESSASFNNSMYLMQSVMNAPPGKAASTEEIAELVKLTLLRHLFEGERERTVLIDMLATNRKSHFITRVEFVGGLKDLGKGAKQVEHALALLKELQSPGEVVGQLGKMIAMDLFIGNYDRFDYNGEVANLGNIFFKFDKKGQLQIVALDSFMDGSGHANLLRDPKLGGREMSSAKSGLKFKALIDNSVEQQNHALACAASLNAELIKALKGVELARPDQEGEIFKIRIAASYIMGGMQEAMHELGKAIKLKRGSNKNPLTQGLIDRYDLLMRGGI